MSDRAVQDEIIRYLADGKLRASERHSAPILDTEALKAARFAHFLARRYYRDRLARSFRYSQRFRKTLRRAAEEVVDGTEFSEFLKGCVIGSLKSAQRVGAMARSHLMVAPYPAWWPELLEYECAYFLQAATAERATVGDRPSPGASAVCRRFAWALPEVLLRLRAGKDIGDELRSKSTLLFSRTHTGRIYVVEVEPAVEKVFCAVDGRRTEDEVAEATGVAAEDVCRILVSLDSIGAVQNPLPA